MSARLTIYAGALLSLCAACSPPRGRTQAPKGTTVIRVNLLGYTPSGSKTAVWATKGAALPDSFSLVNADNGQTVLRSGSGTDFGAYGPFRHTLRLDFSRFTRPGTYYLQAGAGRSPRFRIAGDVYAGTADFCLQYLRQQRSGYNPYLKDSCHTADGYTLYGPMPDSTRIDVWGGWHDASDYLQYVTTSATTTYYLLAAARDFPGIFLDSCAANGLGGANGMPDVLDEARWGLDWLLKMHPRPDWMFNQIADDRDHAGFRLPNEDTVNYGLGRARPVYFCSGEPQGLGKYRNHSTGTASTAGKFAAAFALGEALFTDSDPAYARLLKARSFSAYRFGEAHPGVCQTAPNKAPYYYMEDDWHDDMELAAAMLWRMTGENRYRQAARAHAAEAAHKPWMGADTASHYQWYPFYNAGHYELASQEQATERERLIGYYRDGLAAVWQQARGNAFYRGIPFIWCSNNLTAAFAIQCRLYRRLSGDSSYLPLEQACIDWLLGCNPWGTTMVVDLPAGGDHPADPHSAFSHLHHYPVSGGLVDGPVYGSIYSGLIGVHLSGPDAYEPFQSALAVYHDDWADYSTNEPTTDGTATMLYLLAALDAEARQGQQNETISHGAVIRGDSSIPALALVFTGHDFADGGSAIARTLREKGVHASFFLTGHFYRTHPQLIRRLRRDGHYLGSHSNSHPLYCSWENRDSLLVTAKQFREDLDSAYATMQAFGIDRAQAPYYLPAYEWYNDSIAAWTRRAGLRLVCFTPGSGSNADYSYPEMGERYRSSEAIFRRILNYEKRPSGLNGHLLLLHIGTDARRHDKFYAWLPRLIDSLRGRGYRLLRIDSLLGPVMP